MIKFYREPNGDYCCVETSTAKYYRQLGTPNIREGRAAAIIGLVTSVCTTGISTGFLKRCRRVDRAHVPTQWKHYMGV